MTDARITLSNYRCFVDQTKAVVDLGTGFTALVGPNNAGKSTFLRLFYELRALFSSLHNLNVLMPLLEGAAQHFSAQGTEDPIEIFSNTNDRPLTVEIRFPGCAADEVDKVVITIRRSAPTRFSADLYYDSSSRKLPSYQTTIDDEKALYRFFGGDSSVDISLKRLFAFADWVAGSVFIGAFRNAINEGAGSHFDLPVGTAFINQWNSWKTGAARYQNKVAQEVADTLAHIFGFGRMEINATPGEQSFQVILDGKPYRLRELGSGLALFIIVLGHVAMRKPEYILIDEPELDLHPSLQLDFMTSLAAYAGRGLMFATHSVGLARSCADRIYSFRKAAEFCRVQPFEQTANIPEFLGEMSFSIFRELGHDTVLLVEGVTDVKTMQQFLRAFGKDHTVVVLPLGGNQLIRDDVGAELAELARLSGNVAVIIDSERASDTDSPPPDRTRFAELCRNLGFRVHVTDRRATENYLTDRAVKLAMGEPYRALGPYERLANAPNGWPKSENWRIARAMSVDEMRAADLGLFIASLP